MVEEPGGLYKALPQVEEDVRRLILEDETGPVHQFGATLHNLAHALQRVDEELEGLTAANPNLAAVLRGIVSGLYDVFGEQLASEQDKAFLRAISYFNAFIILRTLDLQWRRNQPP